MSKFPTKIDHDFHVITIPKDFAPADVEELKGQIKSWLLLKNEIHVFDFKEVKSLARPMYAPLINFKHSLKSAQKQIFSINVDRYLRQEMAADGLTSVFSPVDSMDEIKQTTNAPAKGPVIDVNFINPFIIATVESLKIQASLDAKPLKPSLKGKDFNVNIGIAGIIALVSKQFHGNIALCFPAATFLKIYEIVFSDKKTEISAEIEDFAGEILNIIYGQAKIKLNGQNGLSLDRAIPTILTGERLRLRQMSGSVTVVLPFETAAGPFHIEIEKADNLQRSAA